MNLNTPVPEESRGEPFRILFVCTGNTCRSPMAEGIARQQLEALGWTGVEVASAGVSALPGSRASAGAVRVGRARGVELGEHRASILGRERLGQADLILVMSSGHLEVVRGLGAGERAALLDGFARTGRVGDGGGMPIMDPIGGDDQRYEATWIELEERIRQSLLRLEPVVSP